MPSRRLLFVTPAFLLLCQCGTGLTPGDVEGGIYTAACDASNITINLYTNNKITGTITDVYDVYREYTNPNSSNTREEQKTILKAEIDLTIIDGFSAIVEGTAKVTWERHHKLVYRQSPAVCADGQNIDSDVRTWTVNIKGTIFCRDRMLGVQGSGTPNGSDVPTTLHYQDYGCPKANCGPCYTATTSPLERVTWSSFDEVGFEANQLLVKNNMTVPTGFQGEWYHEAILKLGPP